MLSVLKTFNSKEFEVIRKKMMVEEEMEEIKVWKFLFFDNDIDEELNSFFVFLFVGLFWCYNLFCRYIIG